ncbi:energy transducer TonB [Tepidicaulis sp. LMO-SS28]|uniref:energy transducer TonB n=1 Tax=Tepidicaulis sp. LMO-SS28 TaxID=3447455 RepID=UPI003EDEF5B2
MREIGWRLLGAALVLALLAHGAAIAFLLERREPAGAAAEGVGGMNVSVVAGLPAPAKAVEPSASPPEPEPEVVEELPPEPDALPVLPAKKPVKKPERPKQAQKPLPEPQQSQPEKVKLKEPAPEPAPARQLAHMEGAAGKAETRAGTAAHADAGAAGGGGGAPGARADYYALLRAHLERFKQYPRRARLRREEGVVELSLTIGRGGEVLAHDIIASSGFGRLDEAVSRMVADASPLPPPEQMAELPVTVRVPVDFLLR